MCICPLAAVDEVKCVSEECVPSETIKCTLARDFGLPFFIIKRMLVVP